MTDEEVTKLKAEAYDCFATIEQCQKRPQEVNQALAAEFQRRSVEEKESDAVLLT